MPMRNRYVPTTEVDLKSNSSFDQKPLHSTSQKPSIEIFSESVNSKNWGLPLYLANSYEMLSEIGRV